MRVARLSALLLAVFLLFAPSAFADGTPNLSLTSPNSTVLFGDTDTITLTANNPAGQPWGYNATFRAVLPAGVTFDSNVDSAAPAPKVITTTVGGNPGPTTLIWSNVSDLSPNSTYDFAFKVRHATTGVNAYAPGQTYTVASGVYSNSDARYLPKFNPDGTPIISATSSTGYATTNHTTSITAIDLTQTSNNAPEGEIMRGVHNHRTTYTVSVKNNSVNPTTTTIVNEYLPAGQEWLGCGTGDNTTDAPTNAGSTREYPGAPVLNATALSPTNCITPTNVQTVNVDPDGAGPRPAGVYTQLTFTLGSLSANATNTFTFVAGIPIRENTLDWNGAAAGNGTPPSPVINTRSNLDNNAGAETTDEQDVSIYGVATGSYNGTTAVTDTDLLQRSAEDIRILKSNNNGAINQGQNTTWTLQVDTSEYRYSDDNIVTDTLPDGLCPTASIAPTADAECQGTAADDPSLVWDSATENVNGTWTLVWTIPRRLQPSDTYTITFHTITRKNYQENFNDATPVLARDSWTNNVNVVGRDFIRCTTSTDCTTGVKIAGDETDGVNDTDVSSAGQTAGAPTIDKTVQNVTTALADCTTGSYTNTPTGAFRPGDKVCYRLQMTFPNLLDTKGTQVTDFLPPNTTYVPGSFAAMPGNNVTYSTPTVNGGTVSFNLGTGNNVAPGQRLDVVLAATFDQTSATSNNDINANLMKVSFANTPNTTFPLRDQIDVVEQQPVITATTGVYQFNGGTLNPANVDGVNIPGGSLVRYRVDVSNSGGQTASNIATRSLLPTGVTCAAVSNLGTGTCTDVAGNRSYVSYTFSSIAAGGNPFYTYGVTIPSSFSPKQNLVTNAGVRTYQSTGNTGTVLTWTPSSNIDPSVEATSNTTPAVDPTNVTIIAPSWATGASTNVNETGNNLFTQATIGETITYNSSLNLPANTTYYNGSFVFTYAANVAYSSSVVQINGAAPPADWTTTVDTINRTITVTPPATYTTGTTATTLTINMVGSVANSSNNVRGSTFATNVVANYQDNTATAQTINNNSVAVTVVTPNVTTASSVVSATNVAPDQEVTVAPRFTNGTGTNVSIAHDSQLVVNVPAGLTVLTGSGGTAAADGATVASGGVYNATNRTVTYTGIDVNAGVTYTAPSFTVKVDNPATSGSSFTLTTTATTTSYPGTPPIGTERTAANFAPTTGFTATGNVILRISAPALTKTADVTQATVGKAVNYTVTATLQPGVQYFDTYLLDSLPANMIYDSLTSATCTSGCASPTDISATAIAGPNNVGFYVGDVATSSQTRVVTIVFKAHVGPSASAAFTNSVNIYNNSTDKIAGTPGTQPATAGFDQTGTAATNNIAFVQPIVSTSKTITGNNVNGRISPNETVTYTVTVVNTGNSPLYDAVVTDRPDADLVNVTPATGSSLVTTPWTSPGDQITWTIPTIAAGASQTLTYTSKLRPSSNITNTTAVNNTAQLATAYGLSAAERATNPGYVYRTYGPVNATVNVTAATPVLTINQYVNGSGTATSGTATVGTPFTWRSSINNTGQAPAKDVDVRETLPVGWNYVPGSATLNGAPIADPSITGQNLDWTNLIANINPGANNIVAFQATPTAQAALTTGTGAGNPHVTAGRTTWDDASGANADANGSYAAGPSNAQALLAKPVANMDITKTLTNGTLTEGNDIQYTLRVENLGPNVGLNVSAADTLPASLTPTAVTGPCTITGQAIACNWSTFNAGTVVNIVVNAHVRKASAGSIVNTATVATADSTDNTSGNNSSTSTNAVVHPTVSIAKAVSDQSGPGANTEPADNVTYNVTVSNTGNATAYDVRVTDQPSARLTNVSLAAGVTTTANTDGWTAGDPDLIWSIPSIPAGGSVVLNYTARVVDGQTISGGDTINNTAAAPSYWQAPQAVRDADPNTDWTELTNGGSSNATLTARVPVIATDINTVSNGQAVIGQPYTLGLTSSNTSTVASANDATSTVTLPAGWSYVPGSATGANGVTGTGQTLTFNVGNLAPSGSQNITFQVLPTEQAGLAGTGNGNPFVFSNVLVAEDNSNSDRSADGLYRSTDSVNVVLANPTADLESSKTLTSGTLTEGNDVQYTIVVENTGANVALNVEAIDTLPTSLTPTSVNGAPCTISGQTVTCNWSSIAAGSSRTVVVDAHVRKASAGSISNSVAVTTSSDEATPNNNDVTDVSDVKHPTVTISKALSNNAGPSNGTEPGDSVTYTITLNNTGDADAYDTVVTDEPPVGLTDVVLGAGADDNTDAWTAGDRDLRWSIPLIPAGDTATITYTAKVGQAGGFATGDNLTNTAAVPEYWQAAKATRDADPDTDWTQLTNGGDDSQTAEVHVPSLSVVMTTPVGNPAQVNKPTTFSIDATNADTVATAYNPTVTVALPTGWSYVPNSVNGATADATDPTKIVFTIDDVGPGQTSVITFQATPSDDAANDTGTGPTNPHTFDSTFEAEDGSGATSGSGGPYRGTDSVDVFITNPGADINTSVTADRATVREGENVVYTTTVNNVGSESALRVVSITTLPADVTRTSTLPTNCTQTGQAVRCTWNSIGVGGTRSYEITTRVNPAPATTLNTQTDATTTSDDATTDDWTDSVAVTTQRPVTTITKTVAGNSGGGSETQPGDTYTYSLKIDNTGTSTAYDVVVEDTPPNQLTDVVNVQGNQYTAQAWTPADHTIGWSINSIPAGESVTLTYTAKLVGGGNLSEAQQFTNTGQINSYYAAPTAERAGDPGFLWTQYTDGGSSSSDLTVRLPSLTLTDTTGAAGFPEIADAEIGQPFDWRLVVNAVGPVADTQSTTVINTLPPNWSYVPGSAQINGATLANPTITGQTLTWDIGGLTSGEQRVITFKAVPNTDARTETNPHTNTAHVEWTDKSGASSSADGPYESTDDTAQANLTFPTLAVTKTVDAATVDAGAGTTYTVRVENNGNAVARNVTVDDTLPADTNYVAGSATSAATGFAEADGTAPSLQWTIPSIAAGDAVEIRVPVTLDDDITSGTTLTNTASATSDERPDATTNTVDITSDEHADVSLTKTGPLAVKAGEDVEWTLVATNAGPSRARNVHIVDTLPDRVSFTSADSSCTVTGAVGSQVVDCDLGDISASGTKTRTIVGRVLPGTTDPTVVNNATVTTDSPQTDATNDGATNTVNIANAVNMSITKTAADATVNQTGTINWTIVAKNNGPSDAFGVKITDVLPAGVTPTSVTTDAGTCETVNGVITCLIDRVNVGDSVTVKVAASADTAGAKANTASVSVDPDTEVDPSDNTATSTVTVNPVADMAVTKSGTVRLGTDGVATYAIGVTNNGPSVATKTRMVDDVPAGMTPVAATPSTGACRIEGQRITCVVDTLAVGEGYQVAVQTKRDGTNTGETVKNVATVSAAETDLKPENDTAFAETFLSSTRASGNLTVTKKVIGSQTARLGEPISFDITVTNETDKVQTGVVAIDKPSKNVDVISVKPTQGTCQGLKCSIGTLQPDQVVHITVTMRPIEVGELENSVVVYADSGESAGTDPGGNQDDTNIPVTAGKTKFSLTKKVNDKTAKPRQVLTYTIVAKNLGGAAANVTVCDRLPRGLTLVKAKGAKLVKGQVCWTRKYWAPKQKITYKLTARVTKSGARSLKNTVTLKAKNVTKAVTARATVKVKRPKSGRAGGVIG